MKLYIHCVKCFHDDGKPPEHASLVELRDDGLFVVHCERGHKTVTALQNQKFEVLFDLGMMALLDGYPREAITSVAAALERFYEFYSKVIFTKHGVDPEAVRPVWKLMENQSERQYGAYLAASLIDQRCGDVKSIDEVKPEIPGRSKGNTKSWKAFRNDVVHKGYLPTTEEALVYSSLVYAHIVELVDGLLTTAQEHVQEQTFRYLRRMTEEQGAETYSTMHIPTLITLARRGPPERSLPVALNGLRGYREWLHQR